jgi:hypothetical protein
VHKLSAARIHPLTTQTLPEVLTVRSADIPRTEDASPALGLPVRRTRRSRVSWLRTLPLLARHIARSMPWVTLVSGCLTGTAVLALMAQNARSSQAPLDHTAVRVAFLPAVAALAFVLNAPFRPVTQTTPVPAWVTPAGYLLLATPVLAATGWVQLRLMDHSMPAASAARAPAVYPLIAVLTGWCAVTVTAAACAQRSRYANLGGAVAAPISFAAITLSWFLPATGKWLNEPPAPPATMHGVTITWYAIAAAALVVTGVAMQDQWYRYARIPRRRARRTA